MASQTEMFGISQAGLTAVVWTLTGLSTLLVIGRLVVRTVVVNRFYWDDVFALFAYTLMLVSSALWMVLIPTSYQFAEALGGMGDPSQIPVLLSRIQHYNVVMQTFFWTILFSTKFSFLFLYKLVLGSSTPRSYLYIWYSACVFCLLSYGVTLIDVFGACETVQNLFNAEVCNSEEVGRWTARMIWVDFAFNVATDLLVILLPMPVLFGLNMRTSQKLSVAAVCCLALLTIVFEIVRTVKLHTQETFLTILYSLLEEEVAVIIVMLPSYRFFISNTEKSRQYRRLLFSRFTLRSNASSHSGFALHSVGRGEGDKSETAGSNIKVSTTISTHASASQDSVPKETAIYKSEQHRNPV